MKPKTKVLARKIITIKGIKVEVRLLEVPIWNYYVNKFFNRILVRCRYSPPNIMSRQELIKEKLRKHKK